MIDGEEAVQHHVLAVIEDYTAFDALWQKKTPDRLSKPIGRPNLPIYRPTYA
jgi:hypothetical protein